LTIRTVLRDSLVEKYPGASFHPVFATFGNQENTYTRHHRPERIDYLMFRYRTLHSTVPLIFPVTSKWMLS
jgi:hypothetical protein